MAEHVVLALIAPMGSFGGLAGHERRGSGSWPGRSALLGLIGAALGVRRDDRAGQGALNRWQSAVSVLWDGPTFQDFHTVQTVPSANIKRPPTRADALAALKPSDNAVLTRRDYRSDCAFGVALWGGDCAALVDALRAPHFVPYLGRKSCPLSAPMGAKVVDADTPQEALQQVQLPPFLPDLHPLRVVVEACPDERKHADNSRVETVWDDPLDRESWHFGPRQVVISSGQGGAQ